MLKKMLAIFILISFTAIPFSFAEDHAEMTSEELLETKDHTFDTFAPSPWVGKDPYIEMASSKLGFGLTNFLMGWTALLYEPYKYDNKLTGIIKGTWRSITNMGGGALHAVTFLIPVDIPLPDGGVNWDI